MFLLCWAVFRYSSSPLDVSGDHLYAGMVGKELRTVKDLYLVDFGALGELTLGDSKCISTDLPNTPQPIDVGKTFGKLVIAGILPKGSLLKISKITKNINTEAEIKASTAAWADKIDLSFTQDYVGEFGLFKKGYFEADPK